MDKSRVTAIQLVSDAVDDLIESGRNLTAKRLVEVLKYLRELEDETLRDKFAAKALSGLTASQDEDGTWTYGDPEGVANEAYAIADAMMKARTTHE